MLQSCSYCGTVYDDFQRHPLCPHHLRATELHPATQSILQFFEYTHLPDALQRICIPFMLLAKGVASGPQNPETTAALRKLLEAKDCAVRAAIFKEMYTP